MIENEQQPGPVRHIRVNNTGFRVLPDPRKQRYENYASYCRKLEIEPVDFDTWIIRYSDTTYAH